jgi:protein-disulfide isomerase
VLGQLEAEFPGKLRFVYKDFPLDFHQNARPAAEAARCAGDAYWPYHDLLFLAQPNFSREDLINYADRLRLDRVSFIACLDSGRFRQAVQTDMNEGLAAGVRGTPTFFINGRRLVGAQPIEAFRDVIQDALQGAPRK